MILPETRICFKGQEITVKKLEETGGELHSTALYQDEQGAFYTLYIRAEVCLEEAIRQLAEVQGNVVMPRDNAELDRLMREQIVSVNRVNAVGAMAWFVREFMSAGPLKTLMRQAVKSYRLAHAA